MHDNMFRHFLLAPLTVVALMLAACSGSGVEVSDNGASQAVTTQSASGEGANSEPVVSDNAVPVATDGGVPDWYVCDTDTFFAATIPTSVIAANTFDDEQSGGIYGEETFTFGVDGDNSRCEIFYGEPGSGNQGSLLVSALVGNPDGVARLFESAAFSAAEPVTIGSVDGLISDASLASVIYFEVEGAGVTLSVSSFDEQRADIALDLAERIVQAATAS